MKRGDVMLGKTRERDGDNDNRLSERIKLQKQSAKKSSRVLGL